MTDAPATTTTAPTTDQQRWDALHAWATDNVPGFEVRFKNESAFMKFIGAVMFFNRGFMTDFITTIGSKVYFPDRSAVPGEWDVLAHEIVHAVDARDQGDVGFGLAYLFPQCLAPLALFAVFALWWLPALIALVFLLALAPWPAPGRTARERRGYIMSAIVDNAGTDPKSAYAVSLADEFAGPAYYFMDRSPDFVAEDLETAAKIRAGTVTWHPHSELVEVLGLK